MAGTSWVKLRGQVLPWPTVQRMEATPTFVGMTDPTRRLAMLLALVRVHDTIGLLTLRRESLARGDDELASAAEAALYSLPKFNVGT